RRAGNGGAVKGRYRPRPRLVLGRVEKPKRAAVIGGDEHLAEIIKRPDPRLKEDRRRPARGAPCAQAPRPRSPSLAVGAQLGPDRNLIFVGDRNAPTRAVAGRG